MPPCSKRRTFFTYVADDLQAAQDLRIAPRTASASVAIGLVGDRRVDCALMLPAASWTPSVASRTMVEQVLKGLCRA
jgi:hypothetical protein